MTVLETADMGENTSIELVAVPEDIRKPFRVRLMDDDSGEEVQIFTRRNDSEAAARGYFDGQVAHYQALLVRPVAA